MKKTVVEDKRYYSISEVSRMTGLEQYVLRYWEKEFSTLRPRKNKGGNRLYTAEDVDLVNQINHLRKNEGLTIPGVRHRLVLRRGPEKGESSAGKARARTLLGQLKKDVEDLLKLFP